MDRNLKFLRFTYRIGSLHLTGVVVQRGCGDIDIDKQFTIHDQLSVFSRFELYRSKELI